MKIVIETNKKIPLYDGREEQLKKFQYFEAAFKADRDYVRGSDDLGEAIIHRHECEIVVDYKNRKKRAVANPLIGSIIQKYNSMVFRQAPERLTDDEDFLSSVNLKGTPIDLFMSQTLLEAQIVGKSFIKLDYSGSRAINKLQERTTSSRFYWQHLPYESILNYEIDDDGILQFIVILYDGYALYVDDELEVKIIVNDKLMVEGVEEEVSHGYEQIPVALCLPEFAYTSQAAPLVDVQRKILNMSSLLDEETYANIFTRWVLSGADIDPEEVGKIITGTKRLLILRDQAKLEKMGSDVGQSDQLLKIIDKELEKAYEIAGVRYNTQATPESGLSKMVELESTYVIASTLSQSLESAENYLWQLMGVDGVAYSREYSAYDWESEIQQLRDILSLEVGDDIKQKAIDNFQKKFLV